MSAGHPTRRISFKLSEIDVHFSQEQDVYFLCVKFRIDTISKAMLTIKLSSSYVLIIITTFRKVSDGVRARPPAPWVSILLSRQAPADVGGGISGRGFLIPPPHIHILRQLGRHGGVLGGDVDLLALQLHHLGGIQALLVLGGEIAEDVPEAVVKGL